MPLSSSPAQEAGTAAGGAEEQNAELVVDGAQSTSTQVFVNQSKRWIERPSLAKLGVGSWTSVHEGEPTFSEYGCTTRR